MYDIFNIYPSFGNLVGGDIGVWYLICFYMWLRVLTSRKVAIYSDGIIVIIIIIIIGFLV